MFCVTRCTLGVRCVSPRLRCGTSNALCLMAAADLTFYSSQVRKASWVVHHGICLRSLSDRSAVRRVSRSWRYGFSHWLNSFLIDPSRTWSTLNGQGQHLKKPYSCLWILDIHDTTNTHQFAMFGSGVYITGVNPRGWILLVIDDKYWVMNCSWFREPRSWNCDMIGQGTAGIFDDIPYRLWYYLVPRPTKRRYRFYKGELCGEIGTVS